MTRTLSATVGLTALVVVATGCTIDPRSMELGTELYRNNEYLSAADAFTEAIAASPNSPEAWNNRAAARVRLGDLNGAVADYNRAVELAPKDAEIYYNRGNALVAAGLYQDAIADFTRALTLDANFSKAAFNRGTAYAMLGQRDAAKDDWTRAIALEPDPWTKSAMRRSAGLDGAPAVVSVVTPETIPSNVTSSPVPGTGPGTLPLPRTASPVPANPPVPPAGPPQVVVAPSTVPSASPQALDARALAARAITRELDGDHAGAMQDLRSALTLEPDATRQVAITRLMRLLEASR